IHVPDRDLSGIEIPLPGRRRVVGRVSTENGAAIPALRIALVGAESAVASASAVEVLPAHPELTPSEQGVFSVVVPVGEYRVVVQDLDLPYSVGSFTSGPADLLRDTLKVGAGDTENLALALSIPGFTVSGHVYAVSDGNSRDGSRLSLSGKTLRETLYVVSGPDSSFRFPSVPSGDYMLRVEPGDNSIRVLVNRADVVDVDLVSLRGRASAESGAPVAGVTVWFSTASDPLVFLTRTRDDGTFTVALTRGSYRVQLSAPSGYVLKALTAGTVDLTEETLPVSEAGPRELQAVLEPRVSGS
ncbi:MAG TPA: carboxypeptidase-like regulatory domain-containing protein, partial [Terriglobia bacterium]|nr:carboxypeptidase-like regulatory domain-containing protein [Terriglobia bacterium]